MNDVLKALLSKRGGVAAVLVAAGVVVGGGVVPHDGPEGQAAGAAAGAVCVLGVAGLVRLILARLQPPKDGAP